MKNETIDEGETANFTSELDGDLRGSIEITVFLREFWREKKSLREGETCYEKDSHSVCNMRHHVCTIHRPKSIIIFFK